MASSESRIVVSNNPDYGSTSNNYHKPPNPTDLYAPPPTPNIRKSLKIILCTSKINVLLIFIPLGYLAQILDWSDTWIFTLNFLAIIPLAKLLDFATEDIDRKSVV